MPKSWKFGKLKNELQFPGYVQYGESGGGIAGYYLHKHPKLRADNALYFSVEYDIDLEDAYEYYGPDPTPAWSGGRAALAKMSLVTDPFQRNDNGEDWKSTGKHIVDTNFANYDIDDYYSWGLTADATTIIYKGTTGLLYKSDDTNDMGTATPMTLNESNVAAAISPNGEHWGCLTQLETEPWTMSIYIDGLITYDFAYNYGVELVDEAQIVLMNTHYYWVEAIDDYNDLSLTEYRWRFYKSTYGPGAEKEALFTVTSDEGLPGLSAGPIGIADDGRFYFLWCPHYLAGGLKEQQIWSVDADFNNPIFEYKAVNWDPPTENNLFGVVGAEIGWDGFVWWCEEADPEGSSLSYQIKRDVAMRSGGGSSGSTGGWGWGGGWGSPQLL